MAHPVQHTLPLPGFQPPAPPPLTKKQLADLVSSVKAEGIDFIGRKIGDRIRNHLGSDAKNKIERFVKQVGANADMTFDDFSIESKFLTDLNDRVKFVSAIAPIISKVLCSEFSNASIFVEFGTTLPLSEAEPLLILKETAKALGFKFHKKHVPEKYTVKLSLEDETCKENKIVFTLSETCDGIEFYREHLILDLDFVEESDSDEL